MNGKVAIVTGGTAGIGAAVAGAMADQGASLVVVARHVPPDHGGRPDWLREGTPVRFVAGDVRDAEVAAAAVQTALSSFGRLDVLVNAAGLDARGRLLDVTEQTYRDVFDVNVLGPIRMTQAAARAMSVDGGAIVNVAARSAIRAVADKAVYGAAKAALISLTRTAALELAPRIRVNAVAPGYTDAPALRARFSAADDPEEAMGALAAEVPLLRLASAAEVAQAVLFLAGDASHYVTGTVLSVDGGLTA